MDKFMKKYAFSGSLIFMGILGACVHPNFAALYVLFMWLVSLAGLAVLFLPAYLLFKDEIDEINIFSWVVFAVHICALLWIGEIWLSFIYIIACLLVKFKRIEHFKTIKASK